MDVTLEEVAETLFRYGSDTQLQYIPKVTRQLIEDVQATLQIMSSENTKYLSGVDAAKIALRGKAGSESKPAGVGTGGGGRAVVVHHPVS